MLFQRAQTAERHDVRVVDDSFTSDFAPPTWRTITLAAFLARRWSAPIAITRQIAEGAGGNMRAALADLEMWVG